MEIDDAVLMPIALNGFSLPWEAFMQGICGREHLRALEKLWDAFV